MGTKITASERVFRLQGRSEDDTIFLRNEHLFGDLTGSCWRRSRFFIYVICIK